MSPYSYCIDILLACNVSTISFFASLLEHCQCFPREDVFLILALGSVRGNTVPRAVFLRTLPRAQGVYWILWSLWIISSDINPVDSEYQEIHPYSALNIDSVKINTSLLMMRECIIQVYLYLYYTGLCKEQEWGLSLHRSGAGRLCCSVSRWLGQGKPVSSVQSTK